MRKLIKLSVFFGLIFICGCDSSPQLYKETRILMGTYVEVTSTDRRAAKIAFDEISRIEDALSKYKTTSQISQLNSVGMVNANTDAIFILRKAQEFWLVSGGAFDVTVGPLMDLWGFSDKKYRKPSKDEIKKTLSFIGFDKIVIDDLNKVVHSKILGVKVDLGAIAKGYAVDCAVRKLKDYHVKDCLINAGGDLYCLGKKLGQPWKVAIQDPRKENIWGIIELTDQAVATSGDYEQFFEAENEKFSHIMNPKTGSPADTGVVSATVIANDCLTADALATTAFVVGKRRIEEIAKKYPGTTVKIIEKNDISDNS